MPPLPLPPPYQSLIQRFQTSLNDSQGLNRLHRSKSTHQYTLHSRNLVLQIHKLTEKIHNIKKTGQYQRSSVCDCQTISPLYGSSSKKLWLLNGHIYQTPHFPSIKVTSLPN